MGKQFYLIIKFLLAIVKLQCAHSAPTPEVATKCILPPISPTAKNLSYRDGDVKTDLFKTTNFWRDDNARWPKGKIPYTLNSEYSAEDKKIIKKAMAEWESKTCIRFVPRSQQHKDYVEITPNDGQSSYCYSYVGRVGGKQFMKMYGECLRHAAMIHELGHVIGYNHEHQRPDRDDFITVHFENILPAYHYAFNKYSTEQVDNRGTKYDYKSVMQYPFHAFTNYDEKKPGMTLKNGSIKEIYREAEHLSSIDISKAQLYYNKCR